MALFGFRAEHKKELTNFMLATQKKLESNNVVYNPFIAKIKEFNLISEGEPEVIYLIDMNPIYLNFTPIGWFMAFAVLVLFGFSWWITPGVVITLLGVFWTPEFYYIMFRLGLKKAGYKGKVKRLRNEAIIKELLLRD